MSWALAVIALLVLAYAAAAHPLRSRNVTSAMFFTTGGLVLGPVLGLHLHSEVVKLLAEITLVLVLFSDASRVSVGALRRGAAVPLRLLGIGLPLTMLVGTLVGMAVLPHLATSEVLILAVMLACTDAALGQAVVTDVRLPMRIRQGLNVESGLNDGLCVPIFLIAIGLAEAEGGQASAGHAVRIVGQQLGFGLLAGVVAGGLGVLALGLVRAREPEAAWLQILPASTAAAAAGIAVGLGGSIFIAAFSAGVVFAWQHHDGEAEVTYLVDQTGELFNAVTFVVFGAVILGYALHHVTWPLLVYAVLSLTVVRMLPVAVAMAGSGSAWATVGLLGWFGPRGLASIVFGVILLDDTDLLGENQMLVAVALTVGLSVYAHGLTAAPLTDRYARWRSAHPDDGSLESPADPTTHARPRWTRDHPPSSSADDVRG